jgi:acetolactate synthase-1/2/3 large subunit
LKVKAVNGMIRVLKAEGISWVGTFPTNVFTNACGEEGVENFMVRDERYAVAVADGYSRVSNGKSFGVCTVMGGLNAAGTQMAYGALAQAYEDSTPLLCLTDGVPPSSSGVERFDIDDAFKSVTKWSGYVNKAERVPEYMRRAFTQLRTGRPSPVLLQLPRGSARGGQAPSYCSSPGASASTKRTIFPTRRSRAGGHRETPGT